MGANTAGEAMSLPDRMRTWGGMLARHWRLATGTGLVVMLASATFIMRLPNVYRAETRILVNPQTVTHQYVNSAVSLNSTERLNTLSQQVLSSTRLQVILDDLHLFPTLRDSMGQEQLIERMRSRIGIELKQTTDGPSSFKLSYTGDTAEEVAAVTDRLAQSFIAWNLQDREREAQGTAAFLASQLTTTKEQLDALEEQLRQYKLQHLGELPGQLEANLQTLSGLQVQLQANADAQNRIDSEAILSRMLTPPAIPGAARSATVKTVPSNSGSVKARQELVELRKRYTADYPDVLEKQQEVALLEGKNSPSLDTASSPGGAPAFAEESMRDPRAQMIARERSRLAQDQNGIEGKIRSYQGRVNSAPIREQEIAQLLRDYDTAKEHYRSLLEKTYSAQMASELERKQQGGSFTMLDRARVPDLPIAPDRRSLLLGALAAALACAVGVTLLAEMLDVTVKSEASLQILLAGIPVLGLVPSLTLAKMPNTVNATRNGGRS